MKLILSTSNIMSSGQAVLRRPTFSKSNVELINSLHANFSFQSPPQHSNTTSSETSTEDTLYVPAWRPTPLTEPREAYDITAKLFYLPHIPASRRCAHTKEAVELVLRELGVDSIDLLIVSYPGVSFDADDESGEEDDGREESSPIDGSSSSDSNSNHESENFSAQLKTWAVLESLHDKGTISQLGLSEFSSARLARFLPEVRIRPSVDQINVKDCCVVPKTLIMYAKEQNIELLTHNDCTDILPPGTTRELLGPGKGGAGVIEAHWPPQTQDGEPKAQTGLLGGDVEPQWVIKYTAVVKDRGVIENKGYFAVANLGSCIEDKASSTAAEVVPSSG
jgi:glutamate--cysteine ligase regulatory subunit